MFINLLESFSSMDENQKKIIYDCIDSFINPIKFYLILLILILIINVCVNLYFGNKIFLILNKDT